MIAVRMEPEKIAALGMVQMQVGFACIMCRNCTSINIDVPTIP